MAKSRQTSSKKANEERKKKRAIEKAKRKEERKASSVDGSLDNMIAYVDEYGNISNTPPDPTRKKNEIKAENIEIGIPKRPIEVPMERKGIVSFFNHDKGFGFIRDTSSQESIFTHIRYHLDEITENDRVTFKVEHGPKGLNAVEVKLDK